MKLYPRYYVSALVLLLGATAWALANRPNPNHGFVFDTNIAKYTQVLRKQGGTVRVEIPMRNEPVMNGTARTGNSIE